MRASGTNSCKSRAVFSIVLTYLSTRRKLDRWSHLTQSQKDALVRSKIPERFVGEFWMRISGADQNMMNSDVFEQLCQVGALPDVEHKILKDVPRTMQGSETMQDAEVQAKLALVLRAYSVYDPRVGYCQVSAHWVLREKWGFCKRFCFFFFCTRT